MKLKGITNFKKGVRKERKEKEGEEMETVVGDWTRRKVAASDLQKRSSTMYLTKRGMELGMTKIWGNVVRRGPRVIETYLGRA